jgi:hypothetical protein
MIRFISAASGVVLVDMITVPPTNSLAYTGQELWNARRAAAVFATPST